VFRLIYCSLNADAISAVGREGAGQRRMEGQTHRTEMRRGRGGGRRGREGDGGGEGQAVVCAGRARVCARDEENAINCRGNVRTADPSTPVPARSRTGDRAYRVASKNFTHYRPLPRPPPPPAPAPAVPRLPIHHFGLWRFTASPARNYSR